MDAKLIARARAVKARRRLAGPALWVFSDRLRLPDPSPLLPLLPRGLAGVVLRGAAPAVITRVGRLCRARRFVLLLAAPRPSFPPGLPFALRGRHFPRGRIRRRPREGAWVTGSAHDGAELMRAWRGGAEGVFLSPLFATASHPGAAALGLFHFRRLCRLVRARPGGGRIRLIALGGIDGAGSARLGRLALDGLAAIGAFTGPSRRHPAGGAGGGGGFPLKGNGAQAR